MAKPKISAKIVKEILLSKEDLEIASPRNLKSDDDKTQFICVILVKMSHSTNKKSIKEAINECNTTTLEELREFLVELTNELNDEKHHNDFSETKREGYLSNIEKLDETISHRIENIKIMHEQAQLAKKELDDLVKSKMDAENFNKYYQGIATKKWGEPIEASFIGRQYHELPTEDKYSFLFSALNQEDFLKNQNKESLKALKKDTDELLKSAPETMKNNESWIETKQKIEHLNQKEIPKQKEKMKSPLIPRLPISSYEILGIDRNQIDPLALGKNLGSLKTELYLEQQHASGPKMKAVNHLIDLVDKKAIDAYDDELDAQSNYLDFYKLFFDKRFDSASIRFLPEGKLVEYNKYSPAEKHQFLLQAMYLTNQLVRDLDIRSLPTVIADLEKLKGTCDALAQDDKRWSLPFDEGKYERLLERLNAKKMDFLAQRYEKLKTEEEKALFIDLLKNNTTEKEREIILDQQLVDTLSQWNLRFPELQKAIAPIQQKKEKAILADKTAFISKVKQLNEIHPELNIKLSMQKTDVVKTISEFASNLLIKISEEAYDLDEANSLLQQKIQEKKLNAENELSVAKEELSEAKKSQSGSKIGKLFSKDNKTGSLAEKLEKVVKLQIEIDKLERCCDLLDPFPKAKNLASKKPFEKWKKCVEPFSEIDELKMPIASVQAIFLVSETSKLGIDTYAKELKNSLEVLMSAIDKQFKNPALTEQFRKEFSELLNEQPNLNPSLGPKSSK